jgi:alkaline phosphatase
MPRKMIKKIFLLFFLVSASISVFAQHKKYTVSDAHAHNDYMHPVPFYTAWNAGFGSIEADVFPVSGVLLVSHNKEALDSKRTLDSLYLNPLLQELQNHPYRKVNLLVDIKEDYKNSLAILLQELKPLKKYLVSNKSLQNPLTILISGERPSPAEYKNYPGYIFFDDDLKIAHSPEEWKRVGLVSLSFERYSQWKGEGDIPAADRQILVHVIDSVHQAGKKIRFWGAPDNQNSWRMQMDLNVDFVGTDKIQELSEYIKMN